MNPKGSSVIVPGRTRPAEEWQARMQAALVVPSQDADSPTLAQSLTRLHYLEGEFVPQEEWEELRWLILESHHHHQRREEKHRIWKWNPRQQRQRQVEHYAERAAVKGAAILKTLEERFLLLRGRRGRIAPASQPPGWSSVERLAASFRAKPPDVWQSAAFLAELAPAVRYLLEGTSWIESEDPAAAAAAEAEFDHYIWHAREVATLHPGTSVFRREAHASRANMLLHVALEKLTLILRTVRLRLINWDSTPSV